MSLDWLISRRHCGKDWQKKVLVIREKLKHAILDMPESEEIVALLQGSYINYWHCVRIIEILRETEKDTKNFLGFYSSQRMKDWQEIESLYGKDNLHLAEAAQMLQRLVQYEIPGLKKQINKADQTLAESVKKQKDFDKQAEDGRKTYEKELEKLGLKGVSLRAELLALAGDLPSFLSSLTDDIISLAPALTFYRDVQSYMLQGKTSPHAVLPLLHLMCEKGSEVTSFEWIHGHAPSRLEPPSFELLLNRDRKTSEASEIDFGDDGDDAIDLGYDDLDLDDVEAIPIDVIDGGEGSEGESVARGDEALGILENARTQVTCLAELAELLAFLVMRLDDQSRETASDLLTRGVEQRPKQLEVSEADMNKWINTIRTIVARLNDTQKRHLFRIRSSPQYVEKLVEEIELKKGLEARYKRMKNVMIEKQRESQEQVVKATEELKRVANSTKELQKQLESEISKKYNNRRVNIMGGINAALINV